VEIKQFRTNCAAP